MKKSRIIAVFIVLSAVVAGVLFGQSRRTYADGDAGTDTRRAAAEAMVARAYSLAESVEKTGEHPDSLGNAYVAALECIDSARRLCPDVAVDTVAEYRLRRHVRFVAELLDSQIVMLRDIPSALGPLTRRRARIGRVL